MNRQNAENAKREPEKRLDELAHAVIGAALEVHRLLGPGYLEKVYQKALEVELALRGVPFVPQHQVALLYKGHDVGEGFLDLLVDGALVVELKAVDALAPIHKAQVISYLKATGLHLGLLIELQQRSSQERNPANHPVVISPCLLSLLAFSASWRFVFSLFPNEAVL